MYLYIHEEYNKEPGRRHSTEELIIRAAESYIAEEGLDASGISVEILRTPEGKPYFTELPIEFSVSHTDDLWVCLMAEGKDAVGVDIQVMKEYSIEKIAAKYYTKEEQSYVAEHGQESFYRIWARKEAYAKYTGRGLGKYLSNVSTIGDEKTILLKGMAVERKAEPVFIDIDIRDDIKGACCVKEKEDIWIRKI